MRKRIAAVAALSMLPVVAATAPAQAASSCNVFVPSKVSITSPYRTVTGRYSSGCLQSTDWAAWDVVHPTEGPGEFFFFEGQSSETLDWYAWYPLGTYTVRAEGGYDTNYNPVVQNSPKMTVRVGSRVSASTSRSGNYVTVKAKATRYSRSAETYRNWPGATAVLRQKKCSTCSWQTVKTGTTNRYGQASFTVYASTKRSWQVVTSNTSSTWGRTSSTLTR